MCNIFNFDICELVNMLAFNLFNSVYELHQMPSPCVAFQSVWLMGQAERLPDESIKWLKSLNNMKLHSVRFQLQLQPKMPSVHLQLQTHIDIYQTACKSINSNAVCSTMPSKRGMQYCLSWSYMLFILKSIRIARHQLIPWDLYTKRSLAANGHCLEFCSPCIPDRAG